MNNYNEIRKLLDLYYEGRTTREQEKELAEFFANADAATLPADLEADRKLFGELADTAVEAVVVPEEYDSRITAALENEMQRERNASRSRSRWRTVWIAAGSAAACILACLPLIRSFIGDADSTIPEKASVCTARHDSKTEPVATETSQMMASAEPVNTASRRVASTRVSASVKTTVASSYVVKEEIPEQEQCAEDDDRAGYDFLSKEAEDRLVADNYYVVEDEREAYAIVNSVFSRLGDNMAEGSYRVSNINSDYQIEMAKLYD